mgnify:CR=1 FL=1
MKIVNFSDLIVDRTKDSVKLPTNEYKATGKTAIIDQGQNFIAGYTNNIDGIFTDIPAIIFGDHTRVFKYVDFPFFLGADGVKILKANQEVSYKYLFHYFLQAKFPNTGYARHFKWLKDLKIPLPPLATQKHIAAVLDKCTALIAKHKLMLEKYDTLIKSRFIEMFGDPVQNPMGWEIKKLSDVCTKINDGTHNSPENYDTGDYKYITAKNIKESGFDFSNITYVSKEVHDSIYSRCNPKMGDVLYIKDGVTTGIAMVNTLEEPFSLLSSVALLKQNKNFINGAFLAAQLNYPQKYKSIRENMGGAAITRLTIQKINIIPVVVPPLSLQNDFAGFVQQIDKSKCAVQKSLEKAETLYKALMQQYFG